MKEIAVELIKTFTEHLGEKNSVVSAVYSFKGNFLAYGSMNDTIKIISLSSGELNHSLRCKDTPDRLAFSADEKFLASTSGLEINVWETNSYTLVKNIKSEFGSNSLVFSRDGKYLVFTCGNEIKLWSTATWKYLKTLGGHSKYVSSTDISPDSKLVASGSRDGTIKIWNIISGDCIKTLEDCEKCSVNFSPDGEFLTSGSTDNTVKLWRVSTGDCTATIKAHESRVQGVAFSPDGALIASGGWDHKIKLWDVSSIQCIKTLERSGWVTSVAFSPDGRNLLAVADDQADLWKVSLLNV